MRVPTLKQAYTFLTPLRGRSSIFSIADREENAVVATFTLGCLAGMRMRTLIVDTSGFYETNVEVLAKGLQKEFMERTRVLSIPDGAQPGCVFTSLIGKETKAIVIDDLNTMAALMSGGNGRSGVHDVFTLMRILSYTARINGITVLATVYRNQRSDAGSKRSLTAASDLRIALDVNRSETTFVCEEPDVWPNGRFVAEVGYLELNT